MKGRKFKTKSIVNRQACDICRSKRVKCSMDHPSCSKCRVQNLKCVYSPPVSRSPLTRTYLTKVENRVQALEMLLRKILPVDVEINEILGNARESNHLLSKLNDLKDADKIEFQLVSLTSKDFKHIPLTIKDIHRISQKRSINPNKEPELQPEDYLISLKKSKSNQYDESDDNSKVFCPSSIDGMAAFPNNSALETDFNATHGYFGINSSNGLLKFLLLKFKKKEGYSPLTFQEQQGNKEYHRLSLGPCKNEDFGLSEDLLLYFPFQLHMVECYIKTYHLVYPIINVKRLLHKINRIDESHFDVCLGKFKQLNDKSEISFQVLFNTVSAIGALCELGEDSEAHIFYYQRTKVLLQKLNIFEYSDIQLLEAFILLSNYVQKVNKPNTGWTFLGLAARIATSLGLHKGIKLNSYAISPKDSAGGLTKDTMEFLEHRKRLWWGMYFFDVGTTLTFGRPLLMPSLGTIDIQSVLNVDDKILNNESTQSLTDAVVSYPTIYTALIYESELTSISTRIYNYNSTFANVKNDKTKMMTLLEMNDLIENYLRKLPGFFSADEEISQKELFSCWPSDYQGEVDGFTPKWFALSRLRLNCRCKNLQMLMFRYILWEGSHNHEDQVYTSLVERCRGVCFDASIQTVILIDNFLKSQELDFLSAWYCTYFLFQAILVPVLMLSMKDHIFADNPESLDKYSKKQIMTYVDNSKKNFFKLKSCNKLAGKFASVVSRLSSKEDEPNDYNPVSDYIEMVGGFPAADEFFQYGFDFENYQVLSNQMDQII